MLKSNGCLAFSAALIAAPALAEDYESPVVIPDGAVIEVTVANTREVASLDQPITITSRYRQTVKHTEEGYRVTQKLTDIDAPPAFRAMLEQAMAGQEEVVYDASEDLAPVRIVDYEALIDRIIEGVKKVPGGGGDASQFEGFMDNMRSMYTRMGPEVGAASILKTNNMSAAVQAIALDLKKPVEGEAGVPNPFGGAPLRQVSRITLEALDKRAGKAVITTDQFLDPDSTHGLLEQMMTQLAPNMTAEQAAEVKKATANMTFERTLACRSEMDVKTGLATTTDCTSTVTALEPRAGVQARKERWVITQKLVQ